MADKEDKGTDEKVSAGPSSSELKTDASAENPAEATQNIRQNVRERRLQALLATSQRAEELRGSNESLERSREMEEIAPDLTSMVNTSLREFDKTVMSLGLRGTSTTSLHRQESESESVISVTSLRNILSASERPQSVARRTQQNASPSPKASQNPRWVTASDDTIESEGSFFGSSSYISSPLNELSLTPTPKAKSRSAVSVTPKESQAISRKKELGALLIIGLVVVIVIVVVMSSSSASGKSLPSASIPSESVEKLLPKSSASLPRISDGELKSALEALVGDDIHRHGTSQNMAAWWLLEVDLRRHRSSLERLEQRFLLACFYFATTNNCKTPWVSCNAELMEFRECHTLHHNVANRRSTDSSQDPRSSSTESSCVFEKPVYSEQGNIDGYESIESSLWLSRYSECSWAGIVCNQEERARSVVEINLEGQIQYETLATEILQLPNLEVLNY